MAVKTERERDTHIVRWRYGIFLQMVGHERVLPLNAWMDFDQISLMDGLWGRDDLIKFSRSRSWSNVIASGINLVGYHNSFVNNGLQHMPAINK